VAGLDKSAENYVSNAARFASGLKRIA